MSSGKEQLGPYIYLKYTLHYCMLYYKCTAIQTIVYKNKRSYNFSRQLLTQQTRKNKIIFTINPGQW